MKIVVCDDRPDELDSITALLKACEYNDACVVKAFGNPRQALGYFEDGAEADIVFLDIIMPELSGVTLAEKLRALGFAGAIVFLSVANDFAAQSYNVNAFSYLLKPVKKTELQTVLKNAEKYLNTRDRSGFRLKWRGGGSFILFSELMYVEVQNHHLYFHLSSGEVFRIYGRLRDYTATLLANPCMAHYNRSFVINMDYIIKCENEAAYLKDGTRISITNRYEQFQSAYFNWVFGANT